MQDPGHALITGASSGLGVDFAREYARHGRPLILVARRAERMQALASELSAQVPCVVIAQDLSEPGAAQRLYDEVRHRGLRVDVLVNNAGLGIPGRYLSASMETHTRFLQLMVTTIAELTHLFLPAMEQRGFGRIINVASLAGIVPASAGHTLYGATKAWLIRFSECLALEEMHKGVNVLALCPGFTYTEFHDVNGMRGAVSKLPKFLWLTSAEVVRQGVAASEAGRTVLITGKTNNLVAFISKYLPSPIARALVARNAKNYRNAE